MAEMLDIVTGFPRCNAAASLKLKFSRLQEMQSNEGFRDLQP